MTEHDDKHALNGQIEDVEDNDFSSTIGDLEKRKADLKKAMPKIKREDNLSVNSPEQEFFCKLRADGRNQTEAAKKAYPNDTYPSQRGSELGQMPHIRDRIEQLKTERAYAAQLVDPQESLIRWNELFKSFSDKGEYRMAMEAQKQIDKINGAVDSAKPTIDITGLFRGEEKDEWAKSSSRLLTILNENGVPDKLN